MTPAVPPVRRRRTPSPLTLVALAVAVLAAGGGGVTLGSWNDTATVEGQTFTSGTLDVTVNGSQDLVSPGWSAFTLADLAPGESKAAVLTVRNAGSTPFLLSGTGTAAGDAGLAAAMTTRVVLGGTAGTDTTYPRQETCSGGTQTYSGALPTTSTSVLGTGPAGTVAPAGSVTLCVEATLAASAGNALQGKAWTPTLVLTASQAP